MRRVAALLTAVAACACSEQAPPSPSVGTLSGGVVARVGDEEVAAITVARIADERGVDLEEARRQAIFDALLAAGARADLPTGMVAREQTRLLAHALLKASWRELSAAPVTDAELHEVTQVRWTHWDRPLGYRTVHYVVQVDREKAPADDVARAEDLARRMRGAVKPAAETARREPAPALDEEAMFTFSRHRDSDPAEKQFIEAAEAFDHGDASVVVQALPPCTADGWVIDHESSVAPQHFDEEFAAAVASLGERGTLSEVFATPFGFHVALLLEVTPERKPARSERLEGLKPEILQVRAKRAKRALLERLRGDNAVSLPTNVDAILAQVVVRAEAE